MAKEKNTTIVKPSRESLYERYADMNRGEQRDFRLFCLSIGGKRKTCYNWISGITTPGPLIQIALASYFKTVPGHVWFEAAPVAKRKLQKV